MHLILCLDDRNGLSFCGRRLSRDRLLTRHVLQLCAGSKLWMNRYSADLFAGEEVAVDDGFLKLAQEGEYCFLETDPLPTDFGAMESVTVYRWNRAYPATVRLSEDFLKGMTLTETLDFPGLSHEIITMERYVP